MSGKIYTIDTEFQQLYNEKCATLHLISIGIANDKDEVLYRIMKDFDVSLADPWVIKNVLTPMPEFDAENMCFREGFDDVVKSKEQIKQDVIDFIGDEKHPVFWGEFCAYDFVLFCWLFDGLLNLPKGWSQFCTDLTSIVVELNVPIKMVINSKPHHAGSDALTTVRRIKFCNIYQNRSFDEAVLFSNKFDPAQLN